MPYRDTVFVNGGIYHVFSKTLDSKKPFLDNASCFQFLNSLEYYRSDKANISYSEFLHCSDVLQNKIKQATLLKSYFRVEELAYCLMPNHFHLLLKQKKEKGVQKVMSDLLNSFTRYINIKIERRGPLFLPPFRAFKVHDNRQLRHVSRYIHLNPLSANMVKNTKSLIHYPFSSYDMYVTDSSNSLIYTKIILKLFSDDKAACEQYVVEHGEYQQSVEYLEKLIFYVIFWIVTKGYLTPGVRMFVLL